MKKISDELVQVLIKCLHQAVHPAAYMQVAELINQLATLEDCPSSEDPNPKDG